MSATDRTKTIPLSQYRVDDNMSTITDYNRDMATIDGAVKGLRDGKLDNPNGTASQLITGMGGLVTPTAVPVAGSNVPFTAGGAYDLVYKSGSWQPYLSGNGTPTYASRSGTWVRIGDLVFASFSLEISSFNDLSGFLYIMGFPFLPANRNGHFANISFASVSGLKVPRGHLFGHLMGSQALTLRHGTLEQAEQLKTDHVDMTYANFNVRASIVYLAEN